MELEQDMINVQKKYRDYILEVAQKPNYPKKVENLDALLVKYCEYCSKHNLELFDMPLQNVLESLYIIDSEPVLEEIEEEKINSAIEHLQEVLEKNKEKITDGITKEEAETILQFVVFNTRQNFINMAHVDLRTHNLKGCCKLAQELSMNLFKNLGLAITVNDDTIFTGRSTPTHFFGTVAIPVKEEEFLSIQNYLIDVTYRQFFTLNRCHHGLTKVKNAIPPEAGYFVCQSQQGQMIASQILKNGYIKLNKEIAKIYGLGFALRFIYNQSEMVEQYFTEESNQYLNRMLNQQNTLHLDTDKLARLGYTMEFPTKEKSL